MKSIKHRLSTVKRWTYAIMKRKCSQSKLHHIFPTTVLCSPSNHVLNVPLILPNFHVFLIHATPNGLFATYYRQFLLFMPSFSSHLSLSCSPFCNRFAGERRHKHTNLLSQLFLQSYLQVLSEHFSTPLYVLLFSELKEHLKSLSIRSQPWGAHCWSVCYYHFSLLQCYSRAKELCVLFAQLPHLHVMMTSAFLAKCPIKKSLWLDWKITTLLLCLATWTSSTPVSWRSGGLGSPIFLDNCVR